VVASRPSNRVHRQNRRDAEASSAHDCSRVPPLRRIFWILNFSLPDRSSPICAWRESVSSVLNHSDDWKSCSLLAFVQSAREFLPKVFVSPWYMENP